MKQMLHGETLDTYNVVWQSWRGVAYSIPCSVFRVQHFSLFNNWAALLVCGVQWTILTLGVMCAMLIYTRSVDVLRRPWEHIPHCLHRSIDVLRRWRVFFGLTCRSDLERWWEEKYYEYREVKILGWGDRFMLCSLYLYVILATSSYYEHQTLTSFKWNGRLKEKAMMAVPHRQLRNNNQFVSRSSRASFCNFDRVIDCN